MKIAVIDIGGTDIKHTLYDDSLHFDVKSVKSTPANAHAGVVALMKNVEDIISGFGDFDHIAVSTAGQVNLETGNITYATDNIPGYTNTNIRSILQETFNVPVTVENDVNSAALGEAFGGIMNEVYITNYIREHLNGYIMKSFQHVKIRKAMLGNAAGILGAIHKTQLENK